MPCGLVAMVLFLSTEAMFFAALLASYLVLRMGSEAWPTHEQVHLDLSLGAFNTLVLMTSSFAIRNAVRWAARNESAAARGWLLLTMLLGCLFLGIKGFEYRTKYVHQLWPTFLDVSLHNEASAAYLGTVGRHLATLRADLLAREPSDVVRHRIELLDQIREQQLNPLEKLVRSDPANPTTQVALVDFSTSMASLNATHPWLKLPVVLPGGNAWTSNYYLLTGAHAAHLIAGLIAMACFLPSRIGIAQASALRNLGLYWHFVDGVWLVLFVVLYVL